MCGGGGECQPMKGEGQGIRGSWNSIVGGCGVGVGMQSIRVREV